MGFFPWGLDGLLNKDQAHDLLSPFAERIQACQFNAWERWNKFVDPSVLLDISSMHRGGCVHDLIATDLRREFCNSADEGVEVDDELRIFKLYFTGPDGKRAVVRFRKLPQSGLIAPSSLRDQSKDWYWNRPLDGVRNGYTRLTCGYVLDPVESSIVDVLIALQLQDAVVWKFSIFDGAEGIQIPTQPLPTLMPPAVQIGSADQRKSKEG